MNELRLGGVDGKIFHVYYGNQFVDSCWAQTSEEAIARYKNANPQLTALPWTAE